MAARPARSSLLVALATAIAAGAWIGCAAPEGPHADTLAAATTLATDRNLPILIDFYSPT